MEKETQKIVEKLSKKFNKKEQILNCMIQILSNEKHSNKEIEETIVSFYKNNN